MWYLTKVREVGTAATMGPCVLVILRVKLACINLLGMSFYYVKKMSKCMNLMSGSILVSQSKERTKNRKRHKSTNNYAALLYNN